MLQSSRASKKHQKIQNIFLHFILFISISRTVFQVRAFSIDKWLKNDKIVLYNYNESGDFLNQYILDEIDCITNSGKPSQYKIRNHIVKHEYVVFVRDDSVSKLFGCAVMKLAKGIDSMIAHIVLCNDEAKSFVNDFAGFDVLSATGEEAAFRERVIFYDGIDQFVHSGVQFTFDGVRIVTSVDASNTKYDNAEVRQAYICDMRKILEFCYNHNIAKLVHSSVIPDIQDLPNGMVSIAEREYEFYAAQFGAESREQFVLDVEEEFRKYAIDGMNIVASRSAHIFGPTCENSYINEIINSFKTDHCVNVDTADHNQYFDLNYIRYVTAVIFYMFKKCKKGNIYHLAQFSATPYSVGISAYDNLFEYGAKLDCENGEFKPASFRRLCNKKIYAMSPKLHMLNLADSIYRCVLSELDVEYKKDAELFNYDGKLDLVKKIEVDMMQEIKRICEKHDIKYFLVGGSLLGAVRHKGFIPWDDDLDFGMLREDFEKFKKVAPAELSPRYAYQSYQTEPDSHYIFDKIRLRDTFFTTKFSNRFEIENGLFIDILIYDRTAKSKWAQKCHINALRRWTRIMNIRWVNAPRKNVAYKASVIMLPFMRLVPMRLYHWFFNLMLKWYKHSNSPWVIDGVGQNIEKGAFPIEWLEETVDAPFENTTFPIPKGYDAYLRHWYGNNYMSLLPISARSSGHILNRIDLGPYVQEFGFKADRYHTASKSGELLDTYKE